MIPIINTIGIILFRVHEGSILFLLLHHHGHYWNFPKGRAKATEKKSKLSTAFREVQEETGIDKSHIRLIKNFRTAYIYQFQTRNKIGLPELVSKKAIFYLGLSRMARVRISNEHKNYGWFDFMNALKKLHYKKSQQVLKQAHGFLLKNKEKLDIMS